MLTEAIRLVATRLAHPTSGVAALLPTIPRDVDVGLPNLGGIYDETTRSELARQQVIDVKYLPSLLVHAGQDSEQQGPVYVAPSPGDADLQLMIRYAMTDSDTSAALVAGSLVMRAVRRSIAQWYREAGNEASRTSNGIDLLGQRTWRVVTWRTNNDSVVVVAAIVGFKIRDSWASA